MKTSQSRGMTLAAGALIAVASSACAPSSSDDGGDGGGSGAGGGDGDCTTPAAFDISGGFEERYNCDSGGVCTDQDVTIYLDIRLDASDTNPSDGTDYSFCETSGLGPLCIEEPPGTFKFSGSGTLCGNLFTWNAASPGLFTEVGVWDFANAGDTFIKNSVYESIGGGGVGICAGSGRRGGDADPPPAVGGCPAGTD